MEDGGKFLLKKFSTNYLLISVLHHYVNKDIFKCLDYYIFNQPAFKNHITRLIKVVAKKYFDIHITYIGKRVS